MTTKTRFVADVHIGNHRVFGGPKVCGINNRCNLALNALAAAHEFDGEVIIAGDLFDVANPSPQIVASVMDIMENQPGRVPVVVKGNHDSSSSLPGDNALCPLNISSAHVIDEPRTHVLGGDWFAALMPFQEGKGDKWAFDSFQKAAGHHHKANLVAVTHLGMRDGTEAPWLARARDSLDFRAFIDKVLEHGYNLRALIAGNWHDHKMWEHRGVTICQVGTLAPTGFDNPGYDHGYVAELDWIDGEITKFQVPGPRFVKWHGEEITEKQWEELSYWTQFGCQVHIRWTVPRSFVPEASRILEDSDAYAYEVLIDGQDKKASAKKSANSAKDPISLEEAVSTYVDSMKLEEGVEREEVKEACKKYLAGA